MKCWSVRLGNGEHNSDRIEPKYDGRLRLDVGFVLHGAGFGKVSPAGNDDRASNLTSGPLAWVFRSQRTLGPTDI